MRITISGPPGSGKSTACRKLSEKLGYRQVIFGQIFRKMAFERGMTVSEFSALAEKDPSIDEEIDSTILKVAMENEDIILESRLSAYLTKSEGIDAFRVYLYASPEVRMKRICDREDEEYEHACTETSQREESEAKRYKQYYNIDITDLSIYDLIVKTDDLTPDEVIHKILGALNEKRNVSEGS